MANDFTQPYLRIVYDLRAEIGSGRLGPHAKLPSNRELRERYSVAAGTVQRALNDLRAAGLIYSHQGRGSFVRAAAGEEGPSSPAESMDEMRQQITEITDRLKRIEDRLGHSGRSGGGSDE